MAVSWSEEIDAVLGGDLTAALTYLTPAGGAVATCVAPLGLRDRQAGWVGFTTSLGFGKKLDRIQRDPHVAMAFHAREYGTSHSLRYVLVQGRAEIVPDPEGPRRPGHTGAASAPGLAQGWDRAAAGQRQGGPPLPGQAPPAPGPPGR